MCIRDRVLVHDTMLCELIYVVVLGIYTGTRYWHRHSVFTPAHGIYTGTQYLHRHLACYTWYMIYDSGTRYLHCHSVFTPALDIWNMSHGTWYLDTDTWYMSYLTPGIWHAFMWYEYIDLTLWPLTGHYHPWYLYYVTYLWLSLLRRLSMIIIFTRHLVLLNSCILEPLK